MSNAIRIVGKATLREGETGACDCCGRDIRHVVYLSDGRVLGTRCAVRAGLKSSAVDAARPVRPLAAFDKGGGLFTDDAGRVFEGFFRSGSRVLRDVLTGEEKTLP